MAGKVVPVAGLAHDYPANGAESDIRGTDYRRAAAAGGYFHELGVGAGQNMISGINISGAMQSELERIIGDRAAGADQRCGIGSQGCHGCIR